MCGFREALDCCIPAGIVVVKLGAVAVLLLLLFFMFNSAIVVRLM